MIKLKYENKCVKEGQKDFSPSEGLHIYKGSGPYTWVFRPTDSMVFDYKDPHTGMIDEDWHDWKKGGGLSLVNWWNIQNLFVLNRDNIMWVWRYNPNDKIFEFAIYMNVKGDKVVFEKPDQILRLRRNQTGFCMIKRESSRKYKVYLDRFSKENPNYRVVKPRQKFYVYREIGLYYGGANNSVGIWGGAAPKDMCIDWAFLREEKDNINIPKGRLGSVYKNHL